MKFVPTPTSINIVDIITNTEKSLYPATKPVKQAAIAEINNFISKWKCPTKTNMTQKEKKSLKEIKCNPNIIVIPADKGGKIVIMDREQYINQIEEQLNNKEIYEIVKDPTNRIKSKIRRIASKLFKKNKITEAQKYHFNAIENLPTVRGQPKIHKKEIPMRIITCTRSTIASNISQFAFNMIKQLRETIDHCLTNTSELIYEMNQIVIEDDEHLVSLDVKDLFTNVPINQSINITLERIGQSEAFCASNLTKSDLRELLTTCLQNSYFTFNNKFFRQKTGLPMGNILSPLLSDLYMDQFVKTKLSKINGKLWRYVDDLLVITKMNEDDVKLYIEELNSLKGTIKFTHEFENNRKLNYLDTTLTRNTIRKTIDVKWFRKDSASDRLLHYESSHHESIKRNIIKNMTTKIIDITKNGNQQQEDLNQLKEMLIKSKYPRHLIGNTIQTCLRNSTTIQPIQTKEKETEIILSLPYVKGMEVLKRKLEKLKIKLYFSYPKKLNSLVTSNIKSQSKSVIYQIECDCGSIYNGETKVGLELRLKQHERIIEKDELSANSEIVQHHHQKRWQCLFDPKSAFIIDNDTDYRRRKIKEAIYSRINESINHHCNIDIAWNNTLYEHRTVVKNNIKFKKKSNESRTTT